MALMSWTRPLLFVALVSNAAVLGVRATAASPHTPTYTTSTGSNSANVWRGPDAERYSEWINRTSNVRQRGTTCADAQTLVKRYARKTCGGCVRNQLDGYEFTHKTIEQHRYTKVSLVTGTKNSAVVKFEFKAHDCGCIID
jgi:hypothetical protein